MQIGNYKVLSLIGEGSFGRTFKGEHNILKVPVCIKQEKTGVKPYTELFREEAGVIAKLRHPSLPTFMDYAEMGGAIGQVLILSFVEGTPLDKLCEANADGIAQKPIDDEHICWIVDRMLGALSYLHGKHSIVHCDMKPANVIIDIPDHNATVVDMGMASINPDGMTKSKGGTPAYLPPEFNIGLPPVPESDIYSVGKIVCFMTGGNPMTGTFATDMNPKLRAFFEPWIRHDPTKRTNSTDKARYELGKLRHEVYGRTSCLEEFKFRHASKRGHK